MRIAFITSTPLNVAQGSGTFTGIYRLARAVRRLGADVEILAPRRHLLVHTLERLSFNEQIADADFSRFDAVVGFDMDGFLLPKRASRLHVASIKGVVADEARFERGPTRWTMSVQAMCEAQHVRRADLVMTTSRYAADRIGELYRSRTPVALVPEMIDLGKWTSAGDSRNEGFVVLCVCRLFPRKRVDVLLDAAALLRVRIPGLRVRVVGDGPERSSLHKRWRALRLEDTVEWLGVRAPGALAAEYAAADVFCLPSVQEGFGIVYLEAMAAGLPIVAARASATPEVIPHALLAEPGSPESLADALERLYRDPDLRESMALEGLDRVRQYDAPVVARLFLSNIEEAACISQVRAAAV